MLRGKQATSQDPLIPLWRQLIKLFDCCKEENIATGKTSQANTAFHFFDYSHFFDYFHFFDYSNFSNSYHETTGLLSLKILAFSHRITFSHWYSLGILSYQGHISKVNANAYSYSGTQTKK